MPVGFSQQTLPATGRRQAKTNTTYDENSLWFEFSSTSHFLFLAFTLLQREKKPKDKLFVRLGGRRGSGCNLTVSNMASAREYMTSIWAAHKIPSAKELVFCVMKSDSHTDDSNQTALWVTQSNRAKWINNLISPTAIHLYPAPKSVYRLKNSSKAGSAPKTCLYIITGR